MLVWGSWTRLSRARSVVVACRARLGKAGTSKVGDRCLPVKLSSQQGREWSGWVGGVVACPSSCRVGKGMSGRAGQPGGELLRGHESVAWGRGEAGVAAKLRAAGWLTDWL